MSDTPQGEGWWEASDGRWYPPDQVPGPDPDLTQRWAGAAPTPSGFEPPSPGPSDTPSSGAPSSFDPPGSAPGASPPPGLGRPPGSPSGYGTPPPYGAPPGGPPPNYGSPPGYGTPPGGPTPPGALPSGAFPPAQPGGPYGAPPAPPKSSKTGWIILAVVVGGIVLLCGGCVALVGFGARSADIDGVEVFTELTRDFSDAVPASGPASCEVTGRQSDDDYAVDAIITNESGVDSHYQVNYELTGPQGEILGRDFGVISNVEPGEMVRDFTLGVIGGAPDWRDVDCTVNSALRIDA